MDLLERIKDTVPLQVTVLDTLEAVAAAQNAMAETYGHLEALADQHAVGFLDWINAECDHDSAYSGAVFQGTKYSNEDLISIYKRRYPNGY